MKMKAISLVTLATISTFAASFAAKAQENMPEINIENKPESITVVSWGGAYTESQRKAYSDPFEKITGIRVIDESQGANAVPSIKAQHEAGKVTWDLVDVLEGPAMVLCDEGIAMELDYNEMLAVGDDGAVPEDDFVGGLNGCYVPTIVYATLFGYNTEVFNGDNAPKSIADIFDLEKFPGKRGLEKTPEANLEWALIADGVPKEEIYDMLETDEGVTRALAKLDTIKDSVIWWEKGAQPPQLLADKEVVISSAFNGRLFNASEVEGQPIKILWDGQMYELDGYVIPENAPNKEAALAYLKFATDTQRLADQAKYISYGPSRKSSSSKVDKHAELGIDMKPHLPTFKDNFVNPIQKDAIFWADNGVELAEKFNTWLAQ